MIVIGEWVLYGDPMACPRPRVTRGGSAYMPKKYKDWQAMAIIKIQTAAPSIYPCTDPCILECSFVYKRPKRLKKGPITIKQTRPDLDNLIKSICDLLQAAGVIRDDGLIYRIIASKHYGATGADPHTTIKVVKIPQ